MSVLVIRAHERFAVCRQISLWRNRAFAGDGLLIELSLEGCRVSGTGGAPFQEGDQMSFWVDDFGWIAGEVRWSGNRGVGMRFTRRLHQTEMLRLLELCRSETELEEQTSRSYGT